jgi:hypothetical protein
MLSSSSIAAARDPARNRPFGRPAGFPDTPFKNRPFSSRSPPVSPVFNSVLSGNLSSIIPRTDPLRRDLRKEQYRNIVANLAASIPHLRY